MKIKDPIYFGRLRSWPGLLWENKAPDLPYLKRIIIMLLTSFLASPFRFYERKRYSNLIKNTNVVTPPIFILGFWRTGTTYLQNIFCSDPNFGYVSFLHVLAPDMFLSCGEVLECLIKKHIPPSRPMDNMALSITAPQEEEIAMFNLTRHSLYYQMFFPKNAYSYFEKYALFRNIDEGTLNEWKNIYLLFIKKITLYSKGKQLVLKNPSNLCRINTLLDIFPDAKFIHIYRNPYTVILSCRHMFKTLLPICQLQNIEWPKIEEYILHIYKEMMKGYFIQKKSIPSANLVEIQFEGFEKNTFVNIKQIYEKLQLKRSPEIYSQLENYINSQISYKKNQYNLTSEDIAKINAELAFIFDELNYTML